MLWYKRRQPRLSQSVNAAPARHSARHGARIIARRYHFSLAGLAYAVTTAVLVIGAINGQNNLLFWLFGLAVSGLVISGILSGWSLMGLKLRRDVVANGSGGFVTAGEPVTIRYHLGNRNWLFAAFGLTIHELPKARSWLGKRFSAEFDKSIAPGIAHAPYVAPRRTTQTQAEGQSFARGLVTLGPVRVASTFPIGLTRKSVTFVQETTFVVHPPIVALAARVANVGMEGRSTRRLVPSATGEEFFALREFQSGDSVRAVAWRASARADRPLVRAMAKRPGTKLWIVVDDRDDTREPSDLDARLQSQQAFERVVAVAGQLVREFSKQGSEVGLATACRGIALAPGQGIAHTHRLLNMLAVMPQVSAGRLTPVPVRDQALWIHAGSPALPGLARARSINAQDPSTYSSGVLPAVLMGGGE